MGDLSKIKQETGADVGIKAEGAGGSAPDRNETRDSQDQKSDANNRNSHHSSLQNIGFKGANKEIGVIVALRNERFTHKVLFSSFINQMKNHMLTNFDYACDIVPVLEKLEDPMPTIEAEEPNDLAPEKQKSPVAEAMKTKEVKQHLRRLTYLRDNMETLYGLIWGQCSSGLQEVVKTKDEFKKKEEKFDVIWLLEKIKLVSSGVEGCSNKHANLIKSITSLCTIKQGSTESNDSFRKRIDAYALTLSLTNGKHVLVSPELIQATNPKQPSEAEIKAEEEKFKAMLMILRADPGRFGSLQESLFEGVYKGRDEFPTTVTQAYDLLQHIAGDISTFTRNSCFSCFSFRHGGRRVGNVSFTQKDNKNLIPGADGKTHPHIQCRKCNAWGHYANQCEKKNITMAHFTLAQKNLEVINKNWLLLDSCSTVSVICNPGMVTNITPCQPGQGITVVTNGGAQSFDKTASLNIHPMTVHFNPYSLANILSLSNVANIPGARVTMDTNEERALLLHHDDGIIKLQEFSDGLYYLDVSNKSKLSFTQYPITLVQTFDQNKSMFTKRQLAGADKARMLQAAIG